MRRRGHLQVADPAGVWAERDDEQHGQLLEPCGEMSQEAERWLVRPLGVVDRHEGGRVAREVRHEPVEAVPAPEAQLLLLTGRLRRGLVVEQRASKARRTG